MNSVGLNVLVWLSLAVVVGKLIFEHLLTRAEERKALAASRFGAKRSSP